MEQYYLPEKIDAAAHNHHPPSYGSGFPTVICGYRGYSIGVYLNMRQFLPMLSINLTPHGVKPSLVGFSDVEDEMEYHIYATSDLNGGVALISEIYRLRVPVGVPMNKAVQGLVRGFVKEAMDFIDEVFEKGPYYVSTESS